LKRRATWRVAPGPIIGMILAGCGSSSEPSAAACLRIFQARIDPAQVVHWAAETSPDRVWIAYETENPAAPPTHGTFECRLRRAETGGIRIDFVTQNGSRLGQNWATVANADLMLQDLQRYGTREPSS